MAQVALIRAAWTPAISDLQSATKAHAVSLRDALFCLGAKGLLSIRRKLRCLSHAQKTSTHPYVASLQRMAANRKARYSSRFLVVINPHGLPVIWFVAFGFRQPAVCLAVRQHELAILM
ncbi:hypothetical protein [Rhizobium mesosinicum]|uniref:Transposase n=1 Tax=Rhizobium mesosinicum TaxID=335017 RepID=A0ABS7GT96_9HYPH|nr:hypothetical protein [Rhizobium mesosinicum]MBW9053121.1 hypothetical protein [Rhizobium mesosinicum]